MTIDTIVEVLRNSYDYPKGSDITTFVTKMMEADKILYEQEGFGFYVKCSDEMIEKIANDHLFILNPDNLIEIFKSTGDNVHFFGVVSTTHNGMHGILKGLKDIVLKEKPKSFSWWDKNMKHFHRRNLCHR